MDNPRVNADRAGRHDRAVLAFVAAGIVGGGLGAAVGSLMLPDHVPAVYGFDPYLSVTPLAVFGAAVIGGVLSG
jgi:hypothetical protein